MNLKHQKLIIGLLKAGQDAVEEQLAVMAGRDKKKSKNKARARILISGAYPDYGKSLVARTKEDPNKAGLSRALGTGAAGAIIGTLIARILSNDPKKILAGTALGGLSGAIPGYISGRDEAISNYTKLLFLRRLGIGSLGELSASQTIPGAWRKTLVEGPKI